jgi:hypothetical protein
MSTVIPKQLKKDRDQITIKLDRDVLEMLEDYCRYLDSSRDYVINQCLVFIFRKDRPFAQWRASQGLANEAASNSNAAGCDPAKPAPRKPPPSAVQGRLSITE